MLRLVDGCESERSWWCEYFTDEKADASAFVASPPRRALDYMISHVKGTEVHAGLRLKLLENMFLPLYEAIPLVFFKTSTCKYDCLHGSRDVFKSVSACEGAT